MLYIESPKQLKTYVSDGTNPESRLICAKQNINYQICV